MPGFGGLAGFAAVPGGYLSAEDEQRKAQAQFQALQLQQLRAQRLGQLIGRGGAGGADGASGNDLAAVFGPQGSQGPGLPAPPPGQASQPAPMPPPGADSGPPPIPSGQFAQPGGQPPGPVPYPGTPNARVNQAFNAFGIPPVGGGPQRPPSPGPSQPPPPGPRDVGPPPSPAPTGGGGPQPQPSPQQFGVTPEQAYERIKQANPNLPNSEISKRVAALKKGGYLITPAQAAVQQRAQDKAAGKVPGGAPELNQAEIKRGSEQYRNYGTFPKSVTDLPKNSPLRQAMMKAMVDGAEQATLNQPQLTPLNPTQKALEQKWAQRNNVAVSGFSTAAQHVQQLETAYDKWGAGQFPSYNAFRNAVTQYFGGVGAMEMQTIARWLGPETVKAITGRAGGQLERQDFVEWLSSPKATPEQMKTVLHAMREGMKAQLDTSTRSYAADVGVSEEDARRRIMLRLSPAGQQIVQPQQQRPFSAGPTPAVRDRYEPVE